MHCCRYDHLPADLLNVQFTLLSFFCDTVQRHISYYICVIQQPRYFKIFETSSVSPYSNIKSVEFLYSRGNDAHPIRACAGCMLFYKPTYTRWGEHALAIIFWFRIIIITWSAVPFPLVREYNNPFSYEYCLHCHAEKLVFCSWYHDICLSENV